MRGASLAALTLGLLAASACGGTRDGTAQTGPGEPGTLRPPAAFASIADPAERSTALFLEAARVITHPRCANCHPADDSPRQRVGEPHDPPVLRGADGKGIPALECSSCHQEENVKGTRLPGAPGWHLAPIEMAWRERTLAQVCAQIKDPARNGGKSLAQIVEHSTHDPLVGWGWAPGADREPAPGSQATFGALMAAWVETGAVCPREEVPR